MVHTLGRRPPTHPLAAAAGLLTGKHITRLAKAADALAFLGGPGGKVLLVTDKPRSTSLFKSISQRFRWVQHPPASGEGVG